MNFVEYINSFVPLPEKVAVELLSKSRKEYLPKHYLLHKEGEVCEKVYFVEEGLVRWFYYSEGGKDITDSFGGENSFITAFDSFFQRKPSRYFIELLEDSTVYWMTYDDLEELLEKFPEVERVGRLILLQILEQALEKNAALQFHNAPERYEFITKKHPDLLQRVSLGHIASYLGITQETLSRIRAKKSITTARGGSL
jgi:CRP-like cAMP-binding protein